MIKRIEIIFRETAVWSRGSTSNVVPIIYKDGDVVFSRNYPKDTPTHEIWEEIRMKMLDNFFTIFYPMVVWQTSAPEYPTDVPDVAIRGQTRHIREKQRKMPEFYEFNKKLGKWVMTDRGYEIRTKRLGGPMEVGVAESPFDEMRDWLLLSDLQRRYAGQTRSVVLFIYPDRYDEIVRAMFELKVTFW